MKRRLLGAGSWLIALSLISSPLPGLAQKRAGVRKLTEEQKVIHFLDRATFGPRPGDIERVKRMGWQKYLDEQLHPERIPDAALEAKLKGIESIHLTNEQIAALYPPPQVLQAELKKRGIDLVELQAAATDEMAAQEQSEVRRKRREALEVMRELGIRPQGELIRDLQQAKILRAVYSERQLQEVMTDFWFNHFNVYARKGADRVLLTSYERDTIRPHVFGKFEDLLRATARSPAMLFYLDNWQSMTPDPKPPARRPGRFGRNRNMRPGNSGQIGRIGPIGRIGRGGRARNEMPDRMPGQTAGQTAGQVPDQMPNQQARARRGINENYAREIMELHTLGVDGGYTQKDVQEVARCFTGWTIRRPRQAGEFYFNPIMHDDGEKVVLGVRIPAGGGIEDGERVIQILARHPSTAKFISTKLARKFVSDEPPASLVARMSETFRKSDGDIRQVLRAMFTSPEFWSPESYRAKIKTPFEMTVSAVRALGAETNGSPQFHRWIEQMGEGLYLAQPPTGYVDKAENWVNTGALLERMNFSLALVANRIPGTRVDLERLTATAKPSSPDALVDHYLALLLHSQVSPATRDTLDKQLKEQLKGQPKGQPKGQLAQGGSAVDQVKLIGMILGSPEFQRQ